MPLISVVIAMYNSSSCITRCIESILNQTFKDFEIIIVDDGSTDDSYDIVKKISDSYPNIFLCHIKNSGPGHARNFGVFRATANLICFVDSDDFVDPNYLKILYKNKIEHGTKISCCNYKEKGKEITSIAFYSKSPIIKFNEESVLEMLKGPGPYWVVWGKLIDKDLIIKNPIPENMFYEDNAIVFRWFGEAKLISYINDALYHYSYNSCGITKNFSSKKIFFLDALKRQRKYYKKKHFIKAETLITNQIINLFPLLKFNAFKSEHKIKIWFKIECNSIYFLFLILFSNKYSKRTKLLLIKTVLRFR